MSVQESNPTVKTGEQYESFEKEIQKERKASENMEEVKLLINEKAGSALYEIGSSKTEALTAVNLDEQNSLAANEQLAKNEAGEEPDTKDAKKHAEWEAKWQEIKKTKDADVTAKADEKRASIEAEGKALEEKVKAMSATAVSQIHAAQVARGTAELKVNEMLNERFINGVDSALDKKTMEDVKHRAEFAQDLADDGTLNAWISDEVDDYLDSKVVNSDGEEIPIPDSDLENITMGIVAVMHEREAEKDPAKDFVADLAKREEDDTRLDAGVDANDVGEEVMERMGYQMSDRGQREKAEASEAYKMYKDIVSDSKVPAELRGMLIGQLANEKGGTPEQRMAKVKTMYAMVQLVKEQQGEKLEGTFAEKYLPEIGGYGSGVAATGGALTLSGALPVVTSTAMLTAPLAAAVAALGGGSFLQGWTDEKRLERAGAMMVMMEDAINIQKYTEAVEEYEAMKKLTGMSREKAEKLIAESTGPVAMGENFHAISNETALLEVQHKQKKIKGLKEDPTYIHSKELHQYFGISDAATFEQYESQLFELTKQPLAVFDGKFKEQEIRMKNSINAPALVAKAEQMKAAKLNDIKLFKNYAEVRANAAKAGIDLTGFPESPDMADNETAMTEAATPDQIKDATEGIKSKLTPELIAAVNKTDELKKKIDEKKETRRSSGGGGYGGGSSGGSRGSGGGYSSRRTPESDVETGDSVKVIPSGADVFRGRFDVSNPGKVEPPEWVKNAEDVKKYPGQANVMYYEVQKNDNERYGVAVDKNGKKVYYKKK